MQQAINKQWLETRNQQIKKEKEENGKFVSLKNGENKIEIDLSVLPQEQLGGKFGKRFIYTTTTKKKTEKGEIGLLLSASPVLDALIIKSLSQGVNPFTLIKVGEGKETRYDIKELTKE